MSSNSQKATSTILTMGMVWMATSESKSMACSKSDDVNVGDPLRSARSAVPANKSKQRGRRHNYNVPIGEALPTRVLYWGNMEKPGW